MPIPFGNILSKAFAMSLFLLKLHADVLRVCFSRWRRIQNPGRGIFLWK